MKLYLLRHGEAAAASTDDLRPLTSRGIAETQAVIMAKAASIGPLDAIYSSPKLRARETAEIAREVFSCPPNVVITENLKPGASVVDACRYFDDQFPTSEYEESRFLLVTHQPFVGHFMDFLTDLQGLGGQMSTSCLAALELSYMAQGCATLQWVESP